MENKPNITNKPPDPKKIEGLYFDLSVIRNKIVQLKVDLKYKTKIKDIEEIQLQLNELETTENDLLLRLVQEKKLFTQSDN